LANLEKDQTINFRSDFMPYLGKKLRMQKTLRLASISLVVVMLAAGVFFQMKLFYKIKPIKEKRSKFTEDYLAVMIDEEELPSKITPLKALQKEVRRIKDAKRGLLSVTGEKSVALKLTMVLEAFNQCAVQTNLQIEKISVLSRNISIQGSTSSRKNTIKLKQALEKNNLEISGEQVEPEGGRDNFRITVIPKK